MRNIEQMAYEERMVLWRDRRKNWAVWAQWIAVGMGLWGWRIFANGAMEKGATFIVSSLVLFAFAWDIDRVFERSWPSILGALLSLAAPLCLYCMTRLPSFFWGKDPDFWYASHAGAVVPPGWSPLGYLGVQAVDFFSPGQKSELLPLMAAVVTASGFFFLFLLYFERSERKDWSTWTATVGACWTLSLCLPFWKAGTMGSGLVSSVGFLLFLLQRLLLNRQEKSGQGLYFLLGLLASIHPLWGLLGLFQHFSASDHVQQNILKNLWAFVVGLTPWLWLWFRDGRVFPSWGGEHPILAAIQALPMNSWVVPSLPDLIDRFWGWNVTLLTIWASFLIAARFFHRESHRPSLRDTLFDFWIGILSALVSILFCDPSSNILGPTSLWYAAWVGSKCLDYSNKIQPTRKKTPSAWEGYWTPLTFLVFTLAATLSWLPGQKVMGVGDDFPRQHAMNILQTLGPRSVLIFEDPFEAAACRETALWDPLPSNVVFLDRYGLGCKWYVNQVMHQEPELLFSSVTGSNTGLLTSFILNNRNSWNIHWCISKMPDGWSAVAARPTVLTEEFPGVTTVENPSQDQYRFDLSELAVGKPQENEPAWRYFERYVVGFDELGHSLMDQQLYPAAIRAFDRSAKLDPDFKDPQDALIWIRSQKNILEAAQLQLEDVVKSNPEKIKNILAQVDQSEKVGTEARTIGLLNDMVRLNSELADAQYQLSKIYTDQGRIQDANAMLQASVVNNPRQVDAQLTLGKLMAQTGNRIKAEEAFRSVLVIDPQNKEAQTQLWQLLNGR